MVQKPTGSHDPALEGSRQASGSELDDRSPDQPLEQDAAVDTSMRETSAHAHQNPRDPSADPMMDASEAKREMGEEPTSADEPIAADGPTEDVDPGELDAAEAEDSAEGDFQQHDDSGGQSGVHPIEEEAVTPKDEEEIEKQWYILKVQSNREQSICDGLRRRVSVAGLDSYFGDVIVPTEDVAEFKNGKRRVVKRKLYPGYIVVNMAITDETWFLVRETPGIGDFTGSAGRPTPMLPHEVERIVKSAKPEEEGGEPIKTAIPFKQGDRVRIKEGTFENFEGDVEGIDEANGRVTVMINIFGRSTPVELEHWQVDGV